MIVECCHLVSPPKGKSRDTGKWMHPVIISHTAVVCLKSVLTLVLYKGGIKICSASYYELLSSGSTPSSNV